LEEEFPYLFAGDQARANGTSAPTFSSKDLSLAEIVELDESSFIDASSTEFVESISSQEIHD
jgi:hypothetical protein